ncbi:hypothetical protein C8J57DRAFT_748984 [Mycena rebaudengoi]|nr:hypothetical protein C8J57DRAFT_748984 [Mycena rebaudengoi]
MHAPVLSRKSRVSPSVILTVRVSLAEASDQFARVGPIVAAVLGGISAILLLLLLVWFRRRYNARKVRYRQDHPPTVHWFHSFRAKRRSGSLSSWQKDIEAFPKPPDLVISKPILLSPSSMTFTNPNRPLPTVPAITRASTPKDESEGAPLSRSHSQATWTSHVSTSIGERRQPQSHEASRSPRPDAYTGSQPAKDSHVPTKLSKTVNVTI